MKRKADTWLDILYIEGRAIFIKNSKHFLGTFVDLYRICVTVKYFNDNS